MLLYFYFGAKPSCPQGLLLPLYSEITPGKLGVPYVVPGTEPMSATCRVA